MLEIVTGCGFNHATAECGPTTRSIGQQGPAHHCPTVRMLLASGHHRIMAAALGALVMMVLGKVMEVCSRPRIGAASSIGAEQSQSRPTKNCDLVVM
ncbi:hypothetical protein TCAP_02710, partial [Tolypocladium capitatum]